MLKLVIVVGIMVNWALFSFKLYPTALLLLAGAVLWCVMIGVVLASAIDVAHQWKSDGVRSLIPLAVGIAGVALMLPSARAGLIVRDAWFPRELPKYEAVVAMIERDELSVGPELRRIELPAGHGDLAVSTLARRDRGGVLTVEFIVGGAFPPARYSSYVYSSSGLLDTSADGGRFRRATKVADRWWRV